MLDALLLPDLLGGRNRAQATTDGSLPTTNPNGLFQVGDIIWNLAATGPSYWQCTATSGTTLTWSAVGQMMNVRTANTTLTTLSAFDSIVLCPAGSFTVPAPAANSGIMTVYAKASSVTLTPASGQINQAAAFTLTANQHITYITDGTNFFQIG